MDPNLVKILPELPVPIAAMGSLALMGYFFLRHLKSCDEANRAEREAFIEASRLEREQFFKRLDERDEAVEDANKQLRTFEKDVRGTLMKRLVQNTTAMGRYAKTIEKHTSIFEKIAETSPELFKIITK